MSKKVVTSYPKEDKAYQKKRLNSFIKDCQRVAAGNELVERTKSLSAKSPLQDVAMISNTLQHLGFIVLPSGESNHLRIEVIMEPTGAPVVHGDCLFIDLDLEIQKPK